MANYRSSAFVLVVNGLVDVVMGIGMGAVIGMLNLAQAKATTTQVQRSKWKLTQVEFSILNGLLYNINSLLNELTR